jgi:YbbR domain-containing protein
MTRLVDWRRLRNALVRNFALKLFCLLFAVGLWAFVNLGARDAEKTLSLPVELRNVPPNLVVTSSVAEAVDVRIRGPRTILGTIDERRMKVPLNLANVRPGQVSFRVDPERLGLPRGVVVTRLSPAEVLLRVEPLATRRVPVEVSPETVVPEGYRLAMIAVRPRLASVFGPESELRDLEQVFTEPLNLRPAAAEFEETVAVRPPSPLLRTVPDRVVVRARIEEVVVAKTFSAVEVGVRGGTGPVEIRPQRVEVTLRGPQRILESFHPGPEHLFVDASGLGNGTHRRAVEARLPEAVTVSKIEPEKVAVEVGAGGSGGRR